MPADPDCRTPGQLIAKLLAERNWTQRVLAVVLGVDETGVNKLITGKKAVDASTAIALGEVFEVEPERFLNLQQSYDLAKARITTKPDPKRAERARLFGGLPVADMIKRGWLNVSSVRDLAGVSAELNAFFGKSLKGEVSELPHAAKKTNVGEPTTGAQKAWLYRVRAVADDMLVADYTPNKARAALERLRGLLSAAEETRHVPRVLAECGIRFVIVESLPGAKIDGACLWLNPDSPVICMSLRHDRIDNFWFVLRHEIEHVLQGHGRAGQELVDTDLEGENAGVGATVSEEERIANVAAVEFCVPQNKLEEFIRRKSPLFSERDMLGFARTLGVHPGLVAGQLQYRTKRYDRFRSHQVKVRSLVSPSAIVDGWGDVAPVGT